MASYPCGTAVQLTAVGDPGHEFVGWLGDLEGADNPALVTMTRDRAITAVFADDLLPPVISDLSVQAGETEALISWTTDQEAVSELRYGLTTAYELGTVVGDVPTTSHEVVLRGLAGGTLYHFQVTVSDSSGNASDSGDRTLVTALNASGLQSDDFNTCGLDESIWTIHDPIGDCSLDIVGAGTGDAVLVMDVPGGITHDAWTHGNTAYRIMQAANDTDFEIEAKFDSPIEATWQGYGFLVEQTEDFYLRMDFYGTETSTKIFAAALDGSDATIFLNENIARTFPLWIRVKREGDDWTVSYSTDGSAWTVSSRFAYALQVNAVGVMTANEAPSGTPVPPYIGVCDYFMNLEQPLFREDVGPCRPVE
jgi:regulation of enolase protein 1 (concanavalin A-like superfamily)